MSGQPKAGAAAGRRAQVDHCDGYSQLRGCDVVVITAGAKQKPGEPRTELVGRNMSVLNSVMEGLLPCRPDTVFVIVSNPVDILTAEASGRTLSRHGGPPPAAPRRWRHAHPRRRAQIHARWGAHVQRSNIIGSGTYLDSQRLRVALAKRLGVAVNSVHAYVVGEHGDSQVFARSISHVGGCTINQLGIPEAELADMEKSARTKAYSIIERTGATCHGIGACVAEICEAIVLDKREIFPISTYVEEFDAYLGWPTVVGALGAARTLPVVLLPEERECVMRSASAMRSVRASLSAGSN